MRRLSKYARKVGGCRRSSPQHEGASDVKAACALALVARGLDANEPGEGSLYRMCAR